MPVGWVFPDLPGIHRGVQPSTNFAGYATYQELRVASLEPSEFASVALRRSSEID